MRIPDLKTTAQHYVSPLALAEYCAITRRSVYHAIESGRLPAVRVGGQWRIPIDAARHYAGLSEDTPTHTLPTPIPCRTSVR